MESIKEKIKNNKSLTIGELKQLRDYLKINCDISTFNNIDYSNDNPKIFLLQKDFKESNTEPILLPLGHFISMFINPHNNTLYYFDCSDASAPLELHKKYKLSPKAQPIKNFYNYVKKFNIDYFDLPLQNKNSENCGISSLLRIMNKDLTNEQYKTLLKELKTRFNFNNYDDLINHIMLLYLN